MILIEFCAAAHGIVKQGEIGHLLKLFSGGRVKFAQVDMKFSEDFKNFLLSAPCGGNKKGTISVNTSATYFSIFKAIIKQAFIDGYFLSDLSGKIKGIADRESRREYLSEKEKLAFN